MGGGASDLSLSRINQFIRCKALGSAPYANLLCFMFCVKIRILIRIVYKGHHVTNGDILKRVHLPPPPQTKAPEAVQTCSMGKRVVVFQMKGPLVGYH